MLVRMGTLYYAIHFAITNHFWIQLNAASVDDPDTARNHGVIITVERVGESRDMSSAGGRRRRTPNPGAGNLI